MNSSNAVKIVLAVALTGGAALMLARFFRSSNATVEETFFYDLNEKKLFAASRELLPPIRGLEGNEEGAVRAVVISSGNPKNKANQKIAYLEKYAPDLKQHLAKVRAGQAEPLPRGARDSSRFVKRVADAEWHPVNSPEGEKILAEWNVPGPDGKYPAVCTP
jgi:hypothetical protein